ncbi:cell protein CPr6-like protein, partial [Dinothrombium tinctorium]
QVSSNNVDFFLNGFIFRKVMEKKGKIKLANEYRRSKFEAISRIALKIREGRDESEENSDLFTQFLKEINGLSKKDFRYETMIDNFVELFVAGTFNTVELMFLTIDAIANNASIQRKMHCEIDEILGKDRLVSISASNRIIHAKDHASIQINLAEIDEKTGRVTGSNVSYAICGALRRMGESDDCINRLAKRDGILPKSF